MEKRPFTSPRVFVQDPGLLKPPALQLTARDPMGRRASDGGANIHLFMQEFNHRKLASARGQSQLARQAPPVTMAAHVVDEAEEVNVFFLKFS